MQKEKPSRLRFTHDDDILLLREFLTQNPIQNPQGWERIQQNIEILTRKKFLIRTLKQHLQLLLELFLKKEKENKIR